MRNSVVAAFGAAVIAALSASSAAQAATINFFFSAEDGAVTHDGSRLDTSSQLDLDGATLLVLDIGAGDTSGLTFLDTIRLSADTSPVSADIIYGFGDVPTPLEANVTLSWPTAPGPGADIFTETLTTVTSINRGTPNAITVTLSGTVSDSKSLFTAGTPVQLIMSASQAGGSGTVGGEFTNTSSLAPSVPEPSTWVMMVLGAAGFGYAAIRRGKANGALLSI
jgi:hypothetical protein